MLRRDAIKSTILISGYALSAGAIAGVMNGCRAESTPGWTPEFLNSEQGALLVELSESIIPATDTPGAKDVGVHEFIDRLLKECLSESEQVSFVTGLDQLEKDCKEAVGKSFVKASEAEKKTILDVYDQKAYEQNQAPGNDDTPFFTMAKQLTYLGYLTSERVGKEVLRYDPIPQTYEGCFPYAHGDKVWSL